MIKQTKDGEPIFIPTAKILQEIRLLHKELPSFCYSWAWEARCVTALEKDEFQEQVGELRAAGCVKRCELYAKKQILVGKKSFNVRLISYGAMNRKKMYVGPNHLAHAFDKLLFDYVFVFLEQPKQTSKKIKLLVQRCEAKDDHKNVEALKQSYKELLGEEFTMDEE